VNDMTSLKESCIELLEKFKQPVLVEEFCSGREFTAGITGTGDDAEYIGALEIVLKGNAEKNAYSYLNKENCEELVEYRLVTDEKLNNELKKNSLGIWKTLECRDAGRIDFMFDKNNELNFIEANPLAGMNPEHSDLPILFNKLGLTYKSLIEKILISTAKRRL
jgi:D-alanine-D-alanine ligase